MKKGILIVLIHFVFSSISFGQINSEKIKSNSAYLSFLPSNLKSNDLKPSDIPSKLVLKQMGFSDEEIDEAMDYKYSRGKYSKSTQEFSDTLSNVNKSLVNYKKISTLIIVKDNWTQENGIVGPTQKLKRGAVDEKYNKNYLSWHESGKNIIFEGTF